MDEDGTAAGVQQKLLRHANRPTTTNINSNTALKTKGSLTARLPAGFYLGGFRLAFPAKRRNCCGVYSRTRMTINCEGLRSTSRNV